MKRFEVYLVRLDPTQGSEIRKQRPCLVVAPDEMQSLNTTIIAPMTTKGRAYPTRMPVRFKGVSGRVAVDQISAVDKSRLTKRLGRIDARTGHKILTVLREMFAE